MFAALVALILLGIPVFLALAVVGLSGVFLTSDLPLPLYPQRLFAALNSYSLLALPYFILAGELMTRGGLGAALVDFCRALIGHFRGSLAHTTVLSCIAMANVSGSSTAEAAAIGSVVAPAMKEDGYKPGLAAAIIGTAATIGPIIPPSMTMIVYGSITGVSIGSLFLAGIIPGLLIGLAFMVAIYLLSFSSRYAELASSSPRRSLRQILSAGRRAWIALLAPVIILGGIFAGIFTATEAGIVACFYAFVVGYFFYKTFTLRDIPRIVGNAAITTAMVCGIIAVAGPVGWLLAYFDFNETVLNLLSVFEGNPTAVLVVLIASFLFLSMFIESLAVLIVLAPVAGVVSQAAGLDPLHVGILMVLSTQIGATTPPVAVLLFVSTTVAGAKFSRTVVASLPFIATLVIMLIIFTAFPGLVTALPDLVRGTGG